MKLIVFGIGKYYENRRNVIMKSHDEIVGFLDNRVKDKDDFEGKSLWNPIHVKKLEYDKVLLMSVYRQEMREQLLSLGVDEQKIWTYSQYTCNHSRGRIQLYIGNKLAKRKCVLILSDSLYYNGGCIAAMYAAKILMRRDYEIWIAGADGDAKLIDEMTKYGLNVAICPGVPYIGEEELFWMQQFDIVLVNTFPMINCAVEINKKKPVLWWIHEPSEFYLPSMIQDYLEYTNGGISKKMRVIAVSEIARRNFDKVFPGRINGIVSYGIEDEREHPLYLPSCERFIFAIIGGVIPRKAQKVFVKSALQLIEQGFDQVEFWIIGAYYDEDTYVREMKLMIANSTQIKLCGVMTRNELREAFKAIDVVVCSSVEDPLPIVVTEGMMHEKVVITTDATGQASMIRNGENGFVTKAGDVKELYRTMKWVLLHRDELGEMRRKSRETYEQYFTMEKFGERLERELLYAKSLFDNSEEM